EAQGLRASHRLWQDSRRAPGHVYEEVAVHGPYTNQIIATVVARSNDHIDVRFSKQLNGLLQTVRRQGWGIAINGHHPGASQVQEILQAVNQALTEVSPLLCNESKIW